MGVKTTLWKTLFGKEADKLEHANDDERTYYIIEKEPIVNTFISVPKDKGSLNCAAFVAGIVEAVLDGANFPAKVSAHWHKGQHSWSNLKSLLLQETRFPEIEKE